MEDLSVIGSHPRRSSSSKSTLVSTTSTSSAFAATTTSTTTQVLVASPACSTINFSSNFSSNPFSLLDPSPSSSNQAHNIDTIKARIISHPHFHDLFTAYLDCHKVGCPPEVVEQLTVTAREREAQQRITVGHRRDVQDPELDQFMEAYHQMLVKYKEELTRPLQEATEFIRLVESQLNSITNGSFQVISDGQRTACSSDDEQEGSGMEMEASPEIDPHAEDKELKKHLLRKYSGYLGSLRKELSKKKKKGKLPKEARQKLLSWWELHYRWPYPSEMEKVALAESTGLEQKQINNWFINQRKRHWKPSEEMQFAVMEAYHPQNAAAFYLDGRVVGNGLYRLGP